MVPLLVPRWFVDIILKIILFFSFVPSTDTGSLCNASNALLFVENLSSQIAMSHGYRIPLYLMTPVDTYTLREITNTMSKRKVCNLKALVDVGKT